MVPEILRRLQYRNILACVLVIVIGSLPLAACSSPDRELPTETAVTSTVAASQTPSAVPPSATDASRPVEPSTTPTPTDPQSTAEIVPADPAAFSAEVAALVGDVDGLIEVVVALPDGTVLSEINGYEPIEAASLYKLAIMVEVFAEREAGVLSFDDELILDASYFTEEDSVYSEGDIGTSVSIETLLWTMLTLSSNVAATALLAYVGNDNVNMTMASLGLASTEIRWSPNYAPDTGVEGTPSEDGSDSEEPTEEPTVEEEPTEPEGSATTARRLLGLPFFDPRADAALNVTTAADVAALYTMLVNGQIVSETASQEMLTILEDQQINDRLPAYLPEGTVVAHKTGNLDGLIHDAGVVFAPAGPIIVVVLTEDVDESQAIDLIAAVARLAYDLES